MWAACGGERQRTLIHLDHPELVTKAILEVVAAARQAAWMLPRSLEDERAAQTKPAKLAGTEK